MKNDPFAFTKHEYSENQRLALTFLAGLLFVVAIPVALIRLARQDRSKHIPLSRPLQIGTRLGSAILLSMGWPLALWTVVDQFIRGRGTPVPVMATQELLVDGPYRLCRNPMALGTILAYLGLALWRGAQRTILTVIFGAAILLLYIKLIEEKEMEARFGQAYLNYKLSTPFLVPHLRQ